jgi:hypothetical protein
MKIELLIKGPVPKAKIEMFVDPSSILILATSNRILTSSIGCKTPLFCPCAC